MRLSPLRFLFEKMEVSQVWYLMVLHGKIKNYIINPHIKIKSKATLDQEALFMNIKFQENQETEKHRF